MMPSRAFARRALMACAILFLSTIAISADTGGSDVMLVQITSPGLPDDANPEAYTGRVEVTNAGHFVGCAWAAWYRPSPGEIRLVPIAVGYAVTGRKEDIRVETFGELQRLGRIVVKITKLGAPVIGLQDPR